MTVALAQPLAGGASAANNPTLKFPNNVGAGHFLVVSVVQQSLTLPGIPSDTRGNVYEPIGQAQHPSGLSCALYRVRTALGGNTTVTFPTSAPSQFALQEFSGVAPDDTANPDDSTYQPDSSDLGWATGTDFRRTMNQVVAGEYCQALAFALGNVVFTPVGSGWTVDRNISTAALSLNLLHQVPGTIDPVTAEWTTPTPVSALLVSFTLHP